MTLDINKIGEKLKKYKIEKIIKITREEIDKPAKCVQYTKNN